VQSAQVQFAQVQFGLSQLRAVSPQLQSTQLHGSQVHAGFSQVVDVVMAEFLLSSAHLVMTGGAQPQHGTVARQSPPPAR